MIGESEDIEAILEDIARGEAQTFEALIRRYNQTLFRIGIGYLPTAEDAEDAMQNAWLKALENLKGFRNEAKFSTWLCRIMINECLMILRKNKNKRRLDIKAGADLHAYPDPADKMTRQQTLRWLEESLLEIPAEYRSVYLMREVEGLSIEETCKLLDISSENVRVRLHRARRMLKDKMLAKAPMDELFAYRLDRCNRLTARIMEKVSKKDG